MKKKSLFILLAAVVASSVAFVWIQKAENTIGKSETEGVAGAESAAEGVGLVNRAGIAASPHDDEAVRAAKEEASTLFERAEAGIRVLPGRDEQQEKLLSDKKIEQNKKKERARIAELLNDPAISASATAREKSCEETTSRIKECTGYNSIYRGCPVNKQLEGTVLNHSQLVACLDADSALRECGSTLACEQFVAWWNRDDRSACSAERNKRNSICGEVLSRQLGI